MCYDNNGYVPYPDLNNYLNYNSINDIIGLFKKITSVIEEARDAENSMQITLNEAAFDREILDVAQDFIKSKGLEDEFYWFCHERFKKEK